MFHCVETGGQSENNKGDRNSEDYIWNWLKPRQMTNDTQKNLPGCIAGSENGVRRTVES